MSKLETDLAIQLMAEKIPFEREVSGLIPGRKFRVDFKIPPNLVVECQGGVWIKGGHSTGAGITRDCVKLSLLTVHGYRVLHVTADQVRSGDAISWIKQCLGMWDGHVPERFAKDIMEKPVIWGKVKYRLPKEKPL